MRTLVHACCAPCTICSLPRFEDETAAYVFFNPNIHPFREYASRLDSFLELAGSEGLAHEILEYRPEDWMRAVAGREADRCRLCYALRLGTVARRAREQGFEAISTTLLASPYQDHTLLEDVGRAVAGGEGLLFLVWDGSARYRAAVQEARGRGLYTQSYCGCLLSERERYDKSLRRSDED
jgi:predicted adenine nucleotide alpha hydrolase (AANH) superfamily ATPase